MKLLRCHARRLGRSFLGDDGTDEDVFKSKILSLVTVTIRLLCLAHTIRRLISSMIRGVCQRLGQASKGYTSRQSFSMLTIVQPRSPATASARSSRPYRDSRS